MREDVLFIGGNETDLKSFLEKTSEKYHILFAEKELYILKILKEKRVRVVIFHQSFIERNFSRSENIIKDHPGFVYMIYCKSSYLNRLEKLRTAGIYRHILEDSGKEEIIIDLENATARFILMAKNSELISKMEECSFQKSINEKLRNENIYLKEEIKGNKNFVNIICEDPKFKKILGHINEIACTDASILIMGETGTGKELIARAIHDLSKRNKSPFIKINCGAIPETLIETELFGHEKGAFTGAIIQKRGKFELADGGTIFLDEIGELPVQLQPKLLRVLQEGEFERIGGTKLIKINVRVISATNKNLLEESKNGGFRKDLFYRLNVFPVTIPPLRERKKDIPLLVEHFIHKYNKKNGKKIRSVSNEFLNKLMGYQWPGNVRELENVIEMSVILEKSDTLNIPYTLKDNVIIGDIIGNFIQENFPKLKDFERMHILKALDQTDWKIGGKNGAAELLGVNRTTLNSMLKKLDITRKK